MTVNALGLAEEADTRRESATGYRPRRALAEPFDSVEAELGPAPAFELTGSPRTITSTQWAPPVGPPVVADLASSHRSPGGSTAALVARELDRLKVADARWVYINSIPAAKANSVIDHLVIGPGGVFTINAGRHANPRAWSGSDLRDGHREAQRAAELLTAATRICIRVRGLIVPVDLGNTAKQRSNLVEIVNHSALVDFFRRQPDYLDAATRSRIAGYARLSSTWSS